MATEKVLPANSGDRIVRWANLIRAFYGHPVWLVGSQLTSETPRDVDLVVIVPDYEFCLRFNIEVEKLSQWILRFNNGIFDETHWAWSDDVTKKSLNGMRYTGLPIDFKIYPEMYVNMYYQDYPKQQIDTRNNPEIC